MDELWQWVVVILLIAIVIVGISGLRAAFVPESKAISALETEGYTNVQVVHKAWFAVGVRGCGSDDSVRFDMLATNENGKVVDNIRVCTSLLKDATIRYKNK